MKYDNAKLLYEVLPKDKYLLSETIDKLKTGDILLFRSAAAATPTYMFIPSLLYKHVGILYKKDNKLYLVEMNRKVIFGVNSKGKILYHKDGLNIIPLLPRINQYIGLIVWMKLNKPLTTEQLEHMDNIIHSVYNELTFPSFFKLYMSYMHDKELEDNSMYCYKFIYFILWQLELIDNTKLKLGQVINLINNIHTYDLYDEYKYIQKGQLLVDLYKLDNKLILA